MLFAAPSIILPLAIEMLVPFSVISSARWTSSKYCCARRELRAAEAACRSPDRVLMPETLTSFTDTFGLTLAVKFAGVIATSGFGASVAIETFWENVKFALLVDTTDFAPDTLLVECSALKVRLAPAVVMFGALSKFSMVMGALRSGSILAVATTWEAFGATALVFGLNVALAPPNEVFGATKPGVNARSVRL